MVTADCAHHQAFNTEKRNSRHFSRLADRAVTTTRQGALLQSLVGVVSGLTNVTGMAVILILGGQRVLSGHLSIGSLLVFVAYLRTLQTAFDKLFQTYSKLRFAEASLVRVLEILDAPEFNAPREFASASEFPQDQWGHIRFERVSFGYEPEQPVLSDVNLEIHPGDVVAIVGPTGAGKSTLVSLIPRLADVSSGKVSVNGRDVREIPLDLLRSQIAIVLQEPFLQPMSIAENIAYGRPDASRAEINSAAKTAYADEFIQTLPLGYDTVIGERGATLSGGQRQRLAIARRCSKRLPCSFWMNPPRLSMRRRKPA